MTKKQFQAESKRILELMVHSIYTHKDIFLRELISNASDAIDKMYYRALSDEAIDFNKDDYFVKVELDKDARTVTIRDTGIGMTEDELESNLGIIAKSGSLAMKQATKMEEDHSLIGQFGVGFYSAFMVADRVTVRTRSVDSDQGYLWESDGIDGYTIEPTSKQEIGTEIVLHLKADTEDDTYSSFLEEYEIRSLIKKHSDFIRYPIKLDVTKHRPKDDSEEFEDYVEEETINSMVPIWRKRKNELTDEDYTAFYHEKRYGFDEPLKHLHLNVDGSIRYQSILYIPSTVPYDYYTKEFEKGLELYSNGVLIMEKSPDLLPDYFGFVKGMVDSEDLSLNISREMLQQDRQLRVIAKNVKSKIKGMLEKMLQNEREDYEKFFDAFGRQIKFGVYDQFGAAKDELKDLLLFHSSNEKKLVSLKEYVERMKEDQKYIYYATGESIHRIDLLPQTERLKEEGFEILYLTEEIDEFAIKVLQSYEDKEFKSVASGDLGLDDEAANSLNEDNKDLFAFMKTELGDRVKEVRASTRLKSHPVCLTVAGDVSIEMEKIMNTMPNGGGMKAEKVLEVNADHAIFQTLQRVYTEDEAKAKQYTDLLYQQALLIEGLPLEDPVAYSNAVCALMAE
ncbi:MULTISPECIES: molecular chaperone HtpG [unclassified Exiguobacterium]|uniref:molecular chaperone HtpG n=1 Tax=unclassified Exiguobacterium TaxID=2644629 RepID=UPI00103A5E31|nr:MULTISPECIES: molecular chaperone HtpG [unclassified Exiguobacterium]TCI33481.1 molecular chaperone HtpG [Exiguobacterium sp. SH4S7]TCI42798.1 molecular chaperone HtpG [Exiguobacterium sp. SH5S32]TCI50189.1 molecular chaperone HtpG [Exiguobacterium sp. SH1S4]TCI67522.1 molecular chaperone HtpG [Exiguobacterium sp. SH1S1]